MTSPHKHIVQFSGGAGSWATAKRVAERHGTDHLYLLCSDTGIEADDWLPFVEAAAADVGGELVMVRNKQFKDIWELAYYKRILPSYFRGFCAEFMKVRPANEWRMENCTADHSTIYFGYDIWEEHRLAKTRKVPDLQGWDVQAPLMWEPALDKHQVLDLLKQSGLPIPMAYQLGLKHNNCLKTGCFKQGEAAWRQMLERMPEAYAEAERREEEFWEWLASTAKEKYKGKNGMLYRPGRKGELGHVMTLREFREKQTDPLFDFEVSEDWGSCGCYDPAADLGPEAEGVGVEITPRPSA